MKKLYFHKKYVCFIKVVKAKLISLLRWFIYLPFYYIENNNGIMKTKYNKLNIKRFKNIKIKSKKKKKFTTFFLLY